MSGAEALLYDSAARALWVLVLATLPALLPALAIGLVVGLLQAATSIQEATLSFVPKLIGVFLALMLFGGISGGLIADFAAESLRAIPELAR
jgi:flagellar biosynthetic protein FliQ